MSNKNTGYKIQKSINITSIQSICYFDFDDTFVDKLDFHEDWEMVYIDRGECNAIAESETILLRQGEMYFHKPFERHMLRLDRGMNANVFIITFRCTSTAMRFFENRKIRVDMGTKQHISAIIHESSNTFYLPFNSPERTGLKVKSESDKVLWAGDQTVLMRLELMLIEIIRADGSFIDRQRPFLKKEIINDELCIKVVEYMETHLNEKLSMDEISKALSFSKSYISKRFTNTCGCSIVDYFNIMKVEEAKRLISETNRNFFEIADMLMFSNSHYFSTLFKKHTGMTPTQYKKSCIKK